MRTFFAGSNDCGKLGFRTVSKTASQQRIRSLVVAKAAAAQQKADVALEKENLQEPTAKLEVKGNGSKASDSSHVFEVDAVLAKELHDNGTLARCHIALEANSGALDKPTCLIPLILPWSPPPFEMPLWPFLACTFISCLADSMLLLSRLQEYEAHQNYLHHWAWEQYP